MKLFNNRLSYKDNILLYSHLHIIIITDNNYNSPENNSPEYSSRKLENHFLFHILRSSFTLLIALIIYNPE